MKFVYNVFLPKTLYQSSMKPYSNRIAVFKTHCIELRAAFNERKNKQKNAKLKKIISNAQILTSVEIWCYLLFDFKKPTSLLEDYSLDVAHF